MEQCRIESTTQCKSIVEKELLADKEEAMESCEMREVAEIEKVECRRQQLSQSRPSQEVESYCSIIAVRTEQRHRAGAATRRSASWMIENLKAASQAYTINVQAALHGANHVVDQKIETQLSIGQKTPVTSIMEGLVKMNVAFKLPNQPKPFAVDVESNYLVRRPANAWDLKDMMVEDLTSKVNTKVEMGLIEGEKEVIAVDMIAKRTEELKQIVSLTEEFKQCEQMITKGEKLSLVCKKARSLAAILDLLEMNVALPRTIVNNNYVRTLIDVVKASLLPYLSVEPSTYNLRTESHEHAKVQMRTDSMGKLVTLVVDANEQKTIAKNLRYSLPLPMLPIQVRESALVHAIERVTQYGLPTTCAIENNKVRTFDKMVYDYALNNCEHVAFRGRTTGTLKVNGQVMQPMAKVAGRTSLFEDKSNRVVLHEDGVFEIFSLKYGMAVRADHEAVEVKTFQWALRNLACGLCGDMNDEKTADLKSAGKCVMSQPKLAALSYMVEDGQCEGIPAQLKPVYQKEASECKKVEVVPAKVLDLFQHVQHQNKVSSMLKHIVIEMGQKICISKQQIKVCGSQGSPKGIMQQREVELFCLPKDREGMTMRQMAESGDKIERASSYPTESVAIVYEPEMC